MGAQCFLGVGGQWNPVFPGEGEDGRKTDVAVQMAVQLDERVPVAHSSISWR